VSCDFHPRRLVALPALVLVTTLAVACAQGVPTTASPVPTNAVSVVDTAYDAPVIQVAPGTMVTWTWRGSMPHDVAGDGWSSAVQQQGTYQHRFDTTGMFDYRCHVHENMTGRVIVSG
jgi:plastocyanin